MAWLKERTAALEAQLREQAEKTQAAVKQRDDFARQVRPWLRCRVLYLSCACYFWRASHPCSYLLAVAAAVAVVVTVAGNPGAAGWR